MGEEECATYSMFFSCQNKAVMLQTFLAQKHNFFCPIPFLFNQENLENSICFVESDFYLTCFV